MAERVAHDGQIVRVGDYKVEVKGSFVRVEGPCGAWNVMRPTTARAYARQLLEVASAAEAKGAPDAVMIECDA